METVERVNTEIFDEPWKMWAEGTSDVEPNVNDIEKMLEAEGWFIYDVDVMFDSMQHFWRWSCKIYKK